MDRDAGSRCFEPDAGRARRLDARMRERLGDSLRHVADRTRGILEVPASLERFLARLRRGPVDPQAFGAYYDLVVAVEAGDFARAQEHLRDVAAAPARSAAPRVVAFGPPEADRRWDRYRRQIDTDPSAPVSIAPPEPGAARAARARIDAAFALLERGHPALAAEIRALVGEIVLAGSRAPEGGVELGGVASFMLWGGVVLNVTAHSTVIETVEALAHEAAHVLLFGFAVDGPLVANDDAERYPSPLRGDPRPLDGVYHATFVTARMHHALHRLRESGVLDPEQERFVAAALEDDAKRFADGIDVVDRHGRLTPLGVDAMAGAREWMAESARPPA